ncbi:MAG: S9 family peptidase [Aggregatilineales bacterium]
MSNAASAGSRIPLEELVSLPSFYFPTVSHNRRKIAFYWDKTGAMELYVMDAQPGAEPRQVSHGEVPRALRTGFCWTRDDRKIVFAKDKNGDEQHNLWLIDVETGQAEQLTDNPDAQEYPLEVGPDNRTLLVLTDLVGQLNLYAFDLETRQYTRLTDYAHPVAGAKWSPDGRRIVYSASESSDLKNTDVYLMNADGSDKRRIVSLKDGSKDYFEDWSSDGRYISVATDFFGGERVGVYDTASGALRWLSPEDKTVYPGKFSPDNARLLATHNEHAAMNTVVYNLETSQQEPVNLPPGMSYNADWLDSDRFMVNIVTDVSRPELREYRLSDGASGALLPAVYGSINPAWFTPLEYVSYQSADGLTIYANLYRPRHLEPGRKYPALVEIHGGPTAQFFRGFDPYAQFLADNGYIVIQPNPRGSTGYGVAFRDMALMDWGGKDLDDIEGAALYLKSLPEVDPERIGVWGGSYGGYMAFMAVTKKPHLWKAAMAWVGITDLKKLYDSSMEHFKHYLREQMGDPETNAELWADRSAINFAHQMTAHLLIVHGVNDPRCPIEQARVFRERLLELGKVEGRDFEYIELDDEGHGSTDIAQKTRMARTVLDYFQRHL